MESCSPTSRLQVGPPDLKASWSTQGSPGPRIQHSPCPQQLLFVCGDAEKTFETQRHTVKPVIPRAVVTLAALRPSQRGSSVAVSRIHFAKSSSLLRCLLSRKRGIFQPTSVVSMLCFRKSS